MKSCPNCGKVLNDTATQCYACGAALVPMYPQQQQLNQPQYQSQEQSQYYYQPQYQNLQNGFQQTYVQQQRQNAALQYPQNQNYNNNVYNQQTSYIQSKEQYQSAVNNETSAVKDVIKTGLKIKRIIAIITLICLSISIVNLKGGIDNLLGSSSTNSNSSAKEDIPSNDDTTVNDEFYISCAKTLVAQRVRSPATSIWYNEKVKEQDEFGRVLVTLSVDTQNGFGGYQQYRCAVIIFNCNPKEGTFSYNSIFHNVQMIEGGNSLDRPIRDVKELCNWGKPIEESDESK